MKQLKAYIIGSGIAGMATAIRLASQHMDVTVFEKNNYAGGKLGVIEKNGYRFDTGPSLFVQPENFEELFQQAGEDISEYLSYELVSIACKYFYEDGTVINAYTDKEKFAYEMEAKTCEPKKALLSYLKESEYAYRRIGEVFINQSLHKSSTFKKLSLGRALLAAKPSYIFSTLNKANSRKFRHPHTVQLFNRYATYAGSDPYKVPAMLRLLPHVEFNEGVFYPKGGMISLANALYRLAEKKGVTFSFNTPVQGIIEDHNEALGVVANNENLFADIIVSNVDIYFTYLRLLNDELSAKKMLKHERSSSAVIFYWGIAKEFSQLELHNIFFSKDYKTEFDNIFRQKTIYGDPTIYVNITSKCEPGVHAPVGKENWFVMINVTAGVGMNEEELISRCKENVLGKLSRMLQTDIEPLIETEEVLYPQLIEKQTGSYLGALYGASSNTRRAAFFRHPNFSKDIKHLYFTGGSVHPGGGIPLCLKSAKITSDIIAADTSKWKQHA